MKNSELPQQPELVFGLVGPIGVDMDSVQDAISRALRQVQYEPHTIHLTKKVYESFPHLADADGSARTYAEKIKLINELRDKSGRPELLSLLSILHIARIRERLNADKTDITEDKRATVPVSGHAFIVRQLKREEEVRVLRKVYGRRFVQLSVTINEVQQLQAVIQTVAHDQPSLTDEAREAQAKELIELDQHEADNPFGQRLSDTFHTADVFIDGSSDACIREDCQRFVNALFGMNSISPTIEEFGSYMAKAASLRSVDMSRQVGSAICNTTGDLIAIGCNEVSRPGGGNYWCTDPDPQRDIDRKVEANKLETSRIVHDFVEAIHQHGSLTRTPKELLSDPQFQESLKKALVSDITEFGRMTHAEMSALTDAARLGRSVKDATIFVTTFPCHNCAKHLIAAGIKRIVYIEPYPKSRALILHDDALTHELGHPTKVVLEHFHGISPRRFRDIFEKSKRKGPDNRAKIWYEGHPSPLVGDRFSYHVLVEPNFLQQFRDALSKLAES